MIEVFFLCLFNHATKEEHMKPQDYDFDGWATKNDVQCSDGRIIRHNAFLEQDGSQVPLVWNHIHTTPNNVLGHAYLENRDDGVYVYGQFNDTEAGQNAKKLVQNGDITGLSIYANRLKQNGPNVVHGCIREVSLVYATANPEAFIENVIAHGDGSEVEDEAIIYSGDQSLLHSDEGDKNMEEKKDTQETKDSSEKKEKTIEDIINTMSEEQKNAMYAIVGAALEDKGSDDDSDDNSDEEKVQHSYEGGNDMKYNAFEGAEMTGSQERTLNDLSHSEMQEIFKDARHGSLKDAVLEHSADYGIDQIDYLFPEARNVTNQPLFIQRDMGWVPGVMSGVSHSPFSRIKSIFADITEDQARAKGYIKGKLKKEEVFTLLKRSTSPTTVYKKQKLDRDDIIDITDFDVVTWIKSEMRMMLDEEIARAILVGDGRSTSDDDKIKEDCIRPIWKDEDLYTIKKRVVVSTKATDDTKAKEFIKACIKARKDYKGSGNPTLYTTEDMLTNCLLLTDVNGRDMYESVEKLATKLRVAKIVTVPAMEGLKREDKGTNLDLMGLIVNLTDYKVGADKGGAVSLFDDFDIDYNQQKYLIETRCSGALTVPYSAIAVECEESATLNTESATTGQKVVA